MTVRPLLKATLLTLSCLVIVALLHHSAFPYVSLGAWLEEGLESFDRFAILGALPVVAILFPIVVVPRQAAKILTVLGAATALVATGLLVQLYSRPRDNWEGLLALFFVPLLALGLVVMVAAAWVWWRQRAGR